MFDLLKAIDAYVDPEQALDYLRSHIHKVSDSIKDLSNLEENWPILPTDKEVLKSNVNIKSYATAYESLEVLLSPEEESYKELAAVKKEVATARDDLTVAMNNKAVVGAKVCLEKAKHLKTLLEKQRELENLFVKIMLHKWRTAMLSFMTDISPKKE